MVCQVDNVGQTDYDGPRRGSSLGSPVWSAPPGTKGYDRSRKLCWGYVSTPHKADQIMTAVMTMGW